jgi:tetratricopeptide (TPR) repeat protein
MLEGSSDWTLAANLARVFEARNASARALELYQTALAMLMQAEPAGAGAFAAGARQAGRDDIASQLQFRIARCLRTLGRTAESRVALLQALELNPGNLSARLELGRM